MCKIPETDLGIKDLDFKSRRGKFIAKLTDGREIVIPQLIPRHQESLSQRP